MSVDATQIPLSEAVVQPLSLLPVTQRITAACIACGRDSNSVRLLAVSKTVPLARIISVLSLSPKSQTYHLGENYVQELAVKAQQAQEQGLPVVWHMIGHVQSNKTRDVARYATWVHSVDSEKIARRLAQARAELIQSHDEQVNQANSQTVDPLQVCIEVNIDEEPSKSGVEVAQVLPLARFIAQQPALCLRGLMVIPKSVAEGGNPERSFAQMKVLFEQLKQQEHHSLLIDTLSMGMSDDLEAAIAHGSSCVRVGRAIFGARLP